MRGVCEVLDELGSADDGITLKIIAEVLIDIRMLLCEQQDRSDEHEGREFKL